MSRSGPPGQAERVEHDLLGDRSVPAEAYYGIHTLRATENFPISGITLASRPDLVRGLAFVKHAAASANHELGALDADKMHAIHQACQEIVDGRFHDQFVVDVIQGGAGTSTNMNANEVIANRGLEHLGHPRGAYEHLHPLEDVNASQSTNDVYPTAAKVGLAFAVVRLDAALLVLGEALEAKAVEFVDVLKMGRTQLQEAVPMTLGQEFGAYAHMLAEDRRRLAEASELIRVINLGGTAIGTGLNTHPAYAGSACRHLGAVTGLPLTVAENLVEATQDVGAFVALSGVLKRIAVKVSKICNDLRLLSSGPRAGFGEINLPPMQAGSSIMPGKVNPVIPEVVNQIAYEVIGNDVTITFAAEAGQLQLNAFEPIIVTRLFESIDHLRAGCQVLADRCISGITANRARMLETVESSIGLVTALNPYIGYAAATAIANEALATGRGVAELAIEGGFLDTDEIARILHPRTLTMCSSLTAPKENES